jgi:flagellar L-ring protein precursor FlgH
MRPVAHHILRFLIFSWLFLQLSACAHQQPGPIEPKLKNYELEDEKRLGAVQPECGSLWSPSQTSNFFFVDHRAMRVGDLVTIIIDESANAKRGASTELSEASDNSAKIDAFLGLMATIQKKYPGLDPSNVISAGMGYDFKGSGTTSRTEKLQATVPAMVRKVLQNGNLIIEGKRTINVNNERQDFYISGIARPIDIQNDNSIQSSLIAEAEIHFSGSGVISERQSPGWLSRILAKIWPF